MMRNGSARGVAVAAIMCLAACGGGGDDVAGSTTTVGSASDPIDTGVIAPPDTDAATNTTTPPATTSTTTSTTSTTTPPTTMPDEPECLEGTWWLSPEQTTGLYAGLLPGIPVTVTGTHWAEFSTSTVDYWTLLEVRFAAGGIDITFGIDQHGVGSYSVVDDVLQMNYDTFESTIHRGHGTAIYDRQQDPATYVDDTVELSDNGDGTITIDGLTVPVIDIPPVAGGPMGCDGDTMSLGFTSGLADTAAVFVRLA
jgi:hypothetical protein